MVSARDVRPQRRRSAIGLAAFALTVVPVLPQAAHAQTVDQQEQEVRRIVDELERLHERADILIEDYAVAMDEQRLLGDDIELAKGRVALRQAELGELQSDLSTVAVRAFTRSGSDVLGPLLSNAAAYSDVLTRDQLSRVALRVGAGTTDDLQAAIRELELEQIELNRLRRESEDLAIRITGMLDEVESSTAEYESARKSAEQKLGALIRAEEERRAAAALAEYQRLQAEANAGNSGGSGSSSGGGSSSATDDLIANYPAPSGMAGVAVKAALSQIGVPYRYATSLPGVSFDCSGLTHYAWAQAGVVLPRNSRLQSNALPSVPTTEAKAGDLIFYYNPISHVGIYLGDGQMVHAPALGKDVSITSVNWSKVVDVGRPG